MADEYEVGYRRPPKETQFTKGQSGNPNGRPKGSKNLVTMFSAIALREITVTENGRAKTMTSIEAVLHRAMNLAMSGDMRAMRDVLRLYALSEEAASVQNASSIPGERETAVFQSVLKRMERMSRVSDSEAKNVGKKAGDKK
jgi:hypothetical protein